MQNVISKCRCSLMEQKVYYEERLIKAEATILQQSKLLDFLQTKYDEVSKKKRTLGDMFFSGKNKENIDQKVMYNFFLIFSLIIFFSIKKVTLLRKLNHC